MQSLLKGPALSGSGGGQSWRRSGNWVGSDLHSYMESHGVHYMQRTSDYATRTAASHGDPSSVNLVVWIRGTIRILRIVLRKSTKELEKMAIATKAAQVRFSSLLEFLPIFDFSVRLFLNI